MALGRDSRVTQGELLNDFRHIVGHFEPNPHWQLGEGDSAHGVMFGHSADYGPVAVKPFRDPNKPQIEATNLRKVGELGFDALEPLDVVRGGLAGYLVTRHREGLRHLGQIDWRINVASRSLATVAMPTLVTAGETAAAWHNEGVVHNDWVAKNAIYGPDGNAVFADAEKTRVMRGQAPEVTRLADRDLAQFGGSVFARGLLHDRSAKYRADYAEEMLLGPYFDAVKPDAFVTEPDERRGKIVANWIKALKTGTAFKWAPPGFPDYTNRKR